MVALRMFQLTISEVWLSLLSASFSPSYFPGLLKYQLIIYGIQLWVGNNILPRIKMIVITYKMGKLTNIKCHDIMYYRIMESLS